MNTTTTLGTITRSFLINVAKLVALCATLAVFYMHAEMSQSDPTADRPDVAGTPAALVAKHDCWTGEAPEGVKAGHVVVTYKGKTVYSKQLVDEAVDTVFGKPAPGVQAVYGFCR